MLVPDTQPSLLVRLRDSQDADAWEQFAKLYWQVVYRLAMLHGLQPADAEDLSQKVFLSVSRSIDHYEPRPGVAKFRTWLKKIAKNEILNTLARDPRIARREVQVNSQYLSAQTRESPALQEAEYRHEVFLVAAEQVRHEFSDRVWEAFWQTAVLSLPIDCVCEQLQMSRGSLYTARCRVVQRLREFVERLVDQHE